MYKNLRIASCIIAVAFAAAAIFVFVYAGVEWGILCVVAAVVFFMLTVFFKKKQELKELKDNPPPPVGDFITGKVPHDDKDGDSDRTEDNDSNND